ncbi:hypothetical protein Q3304_12600 [Clostridioides sp. GD02377]|uniref:hypothetical protein n=1 Tax=unclassified Clostridioides TaxID=2635829 RepID=UPI0038AE7F86
MKKKKTLIGIAISFLLIISTINPLQVEAEAIIDSSVYISSAQENYKSNNTRFKTIKSNNTRFKTIKSNNTRFKTIKSKSKHKRSKSRKSRVNLKKRTIRTKNYGHRNLDKHKSQSIGRYNILSKLILSVIVVFIVIVLIGIIFIRRKKKKFY